MIPEGFKPYLNPLAPIKESPIMHDVIEIYREEWGESATIRREHISPLMNAIGLYWRPAIQHKEGT